MQHDRLGLLHRLVLPLAKPGDVLRHERVRASERLFHAEPVCQAESMFHSVPDAEPVSVPDTKSVSVPGAESVSDTDPVSVPLSDPKSVPESKRTLVPPLGLLLRRVVFWWRLLRQYGLLNLVEQPYAVGPGALSRG